MFPDFLAAHGLVLPDAATRDNLDYNRLRDALFTGPVPDDLDDILFLSALLGNLSGWDMIERQAAEDRRELPKPAADFSDMDMAVFAAMMDWPVNKGLLERAQARARVHSKSAYLYFAPTSDLRSQYRPPTKASLDEARQYLTDHFVRCGLVATGERGKATEVIPYDFEKEIWFLIRYPGRIRRHRGYNAGDWRHFDFNPEQYDAVAYNKVYSDLRMNTNRKTEEVKYRCAFGQLLFGQHNAFREKERVVVLTPLEGTRAIDLFRHDDIPGLGSISPIELTYETWALPPRRFTVSAADGTSLLHPNEHAPRLLPREGKWVRRVVFQYRLKDSMRVSKMSIDGKNKVSFERDGDSVVLDLWLRRRGFVLSFVKVDEYDTLPVDADLVLAPYA